MQYSTLTACEHRRTGNFRRRGAVNHLPKKFLQVAQIFTKQSKRNEGHTMQQHTGAPNEKIVQNHLNIALLNVF